MHFHNFIVALWLCSIIQYMHCFSLSGITGNSFVQSKTNYSIAKTWYNICVRNVEFSFLDDE